MKTHKRNDQGFYVRRTNKRWKWMASATAAGMTASQASAITINLVNNYISNNGNNLNADLTGDGHPDVTIAIGYINSGYSNGFVGVRLNGVYAADHCDCDPPYNIATARLGLRSAQWYRFVGYGGTYPSSQPTQGRGTQSLTGSIPIFFKDLHINGGAPTPGSLQVTVSPLNIQLDSFTYNSPTSVQTAGLAAPDQGSSLALLAMGSAGVLALRRWRTAQGRS